VGVTTTAWLPEPTVESVDESTSSPSASPSSERNVRKFASCVPQVNSTSSALRPYRLPTESRKSGSPFVGMT